MKRCENSSNSKFRAFEFVKMAEYETLGSPILISRKIRVTEIVCNFHSNYIVKKSISRNICENSMSHITSIDSCFWKVQIEFEMTICTSKHDVFWEKNWAIFLVPSFWALEKSFKCQCIILCVLMQQTLWKFPYTHALIMASGNKQFEQLSVRNFNLEKQKQDLLWGWNLEPFAYFEIQCYKQNLFYAIFLSMTLLYSK